MVTFIYKLLFAVSLPWIEGSGLQYNDCRADRGNMPGDLYRCRNYDVSPFEEQPKCQFHLREYIPWRGVYYNRGDPGGLFPLT